MGDKVGIRILAPATVGLGLACAAPASAQNATSATAAPPPPSPEEIYHQALDLGLWVSEQTLTIPAVAYSLSNAIEGRDDRESMMVSTWIGVHQTGSVATVLFTVTGQDVVFSDTISASEDAVCRHLNDGRWWCETNIETFKVKAAFYLERAALGGVEAPVAARPTTAPPRR